MRGHIMISAVTIGPEVEFYGVSTNCGDMYEISIIPEVTETKNPWKKQPMRTFYAQDVALGIKGGFGPVNWHEYHGDRVMETINQVPIDSDKQYYVKVPIVIRIDDVVDEIN